MFGQCPCVPLYIIQKSNKICSVYSMRLPCVDSIDRGSPGAKTPVCRVAGLLYWNEIWVQERGEMCTDHSGQNHRLEFCKRSETQFIHVSCKPADAQINDLQSYTVVPFYIWQYNVSMIWIFQLHLTLHGCESTARALVFIWIEIKGKQS